MLGRPDALASCGRCSPEWPCGPKEKTETRTRASAVSQFSILQFSIRSVTAPVPGATHASATAGGDRRFAARGARPAAATDRERRPELCQLLTPASGADDVRIGRDDLFESSPALAALEIEHRHGLLQRPAERTSSPHPHIPPPRHGDENAGAFRVGQSFALEPVFLSSGKTENRHVVCFYTSSRSVFRKSSPRQRRGCRARAAVA